jgi:hypothetical protein
MQEPIPTLIHPLLAAYMAQLQAELPGLVEAIYIHGSIALGAFHPTLSDIDAIMVVSRRVSDVDVEKLREIHASTAEQYPQWKLEGSYLQWDDVGQPETAIEAHPTYHDNVLNPASRFDVNHVTWWVLKNHGITVLGKDVQSLDFSVDMDDMIAAMHENMNSYWASWTTKPRHIVMMVSNWAIEWTVLGVLRQYYTFRERDITSKTGAGAYALKHTPKQWHRIIQEAINIREQKAGSLYRFRILRAIEAVRLLRYVIRTSNADFISL